VKINFLGAGKNIKTIFVSIKMSPVNSLLYKNSAAAGAVLADRIIEKIKSRAERRRGEEEKTDLIDAAQNKLIDSILYLERARGKR
jgi:hypothetical protein